MTDNEKIIELLTEIRDSLKKPEPKKRGKVFVPPTSVDVARYCIDNSFTTDAVAFIAFYQSKGWKVGNSKMKDWKAAVRTWEKRSNGQNQQDNRGRTQRVNDKLREIAIKDISENGFTEELD